ncbi:hypothetical protein AGMMS49992_17010 [Clostridia bacterium]|nr:hypothetical protein AGMMS49992_17010 [Clostridia bacterium]
MMKKRALLIPLLLCVALLSAAMPASAVVPYDSYLYDYRGDIVFTPPPYIPERSVSGDALGLSMLSNPQDIFVAPNGHVYVADTGNNRVLELDEALTRTLRVYDGYTDDQDQAHNFSQPTGMAVDADGLLYIADSNNRRVVVLDDGRYVRAIENPVSDVLPDSYVFTPLRLAIDSMGSVYVIAKGMFQGIMTFESEGGFIGFFGTIHVKITPWEKFWRRFSTKEQRQSGVLFIPTEFTGVAVDDAGFLLASNVDDTGAQAVRRLNPNGEDVARKSEQGGLGGDLIIGGNSPYAGPSIVVDVVARDHGIYSLLDSKRGRIFTYDRDGNMLYIFGGLGNQVGTFRTPTAIDETASGALIVLDAVQGEIVVFRPTAYGQAINDAVALRYNGDDAGAVARWRDVLRLNENLELALVGLGKSELARGDNQSAAEYLRLGMNQTYYSIAFKRLRDDMLARYAGWAVIGVAALAIILIVRSVRRKRPAHSERMVR